MGLFGKRPVKGITAQELDKKHFGSSTLKERMHSVINGYNKNDRDKKRAILDHTLGLVNDRDPDMPRSQTQGIIEPAEFEAAVGGLEQSKVISKDEAARLRTVAHDALSN